MIASSMMGHYQFTLARCKSMILCKHKNTGETHFSLPSCDFLSKGIEMHKSNFLRMQKNWTIQHKILS